MEETETTVPSNDEVAKQIFELLSGHPHQHEVPYIAETLELSTDQVIEVMNDYGPDGQGGVEYRGPGQGGGWLPDEIAEQYRTEVREPEHIGYRWPDGELRDVIFDKDDDEHLARMGLVRSETPDVAR